MFRKGLLLVTGPSCRTIPRYIHTHAPYVGKATYTRPHARDRRGGTCISGCRVLSDLSITIYEYIVPERA